MIRFRFVQDRQATFEVKRMCELVEVPRSSLYAWSNHTPSARELAGVELLVTIRDIYQRSRNTYGTPRIYGQLRRTGHRVARCRVAHLMRVNGVVGARRRRSGGAVDLMPAVWQTC